MNDDTRTDAERRLRDIVARADSYGNTSQVVSIEDLRVVLAESTDSAPGYTHILDWNGTEWWVTTRRNGEAHSGMPADQFMVDHPEGSFS